MIWGKVEVDKREVTLDDMWSIDLAKMNEFKLVQPLSEAAVEWMEDEADVDEEGDPPEGWVDSDDDGELGEEPDSDGEVGVCTLVFFVSSCSFSRLARSLCYFLVGAVSSLSGGCRSLIPS